jgi:hypothetical protein
MVAVAQAAPRLWRWTGAAFALLASLGLPAGQMARSATQFSLHGFYDAEDLARDLLRPLPAGTVLFTSYFKSIFVLWELCAVDGERPDITLVHRNFLRYPGYASAQAALHAELGPLLLAYATEGRFPRGALEALARRRPVAMEFDFNLQPDIAQSIVPGGWTWSLGEDTEATALRAQNRFWEEAYARAAGDLAEPETRRFYLWSHYLHAVAALRRGWTELARVEARRGLALSPESPELLRIARGDAEAP